MSMTKTVTLHCNAGNHSWERPSQRGKRPLNCPDCAPKKVKQDKPTIVTVVNAMTEPKKVISPEMIAKAEAEYNEAAENAKSAFLKVDAQKDTHSDAFDAANDAWKAAERQVEIKFKTMMNMVGK